VTTAKPELSIDAIEANPALAADLSPAQRQAIVQRCAAVILVMSAIAIEAPAPGEIPAPANASHKVKAAQAVQASAGDMITPREAASRLKLAHGTVKNWLGRLGPADGVFRQGAKCTRIDWQIFNERFRDGTLGRKGTK
jgi:hypothetical protein